MKRAYVELTREHLEDLLGFSEGGIRIVTLQHRLEYDMFVMYLYGNIFPECKEGELAPKIEIEIVSGKRIEFK